MVWRSFYLHCMIAFILRIILIIYANIHDNYFQVPYTDIDYKVYTDAARFLTQGESPYNRHTYRYSPLLAFILTPNIFLFIDFGKIFFSFVDIVAAILIRNILLNRSCTEKIASICALSWIFNPMTIVISTRGNADALIVVLVLLTIRSINKNDLILGSIHGLSVHFRLYPMLFTLAIYLSLREENKNFNFVPNKNQLKFILSFFFSLVFFTTISYYFYGYQFFRESFVYHLIRKDARHNFSLFFYMLYLSVEKNVMIAEKFLRAVPPLVLLIVVSVRYGNKHDLPFAMLIQAMIMVTYNSVVTSQYFFWYLSLLPLCIPYIQMSSARYFILATVWFIPQVLWLFDAYCLEFLGINKFLYLWIDAIIFFIANTKIIYDFVQHYNSKYVIKN